VVGQRSGQTVDYQLDGPYDDYTHETNSRSVLLLPCPASKNHRFRLLLVAVCRRAFSEERQLAIHDFLAGCMRFGCSDRSTTQYAVGKVCGVVPCGGEDNSQGESTASPSIGKAQGLKDWIEATIDELDSLRSTLERLWTLWDSAGTLSKTELPRHFGGWLLYGQLQHRGWRCLQDSVHRRRSVHLCYD
jgi:hypothetical protein